MGMRVWQHLDGRLNKNVPADPAAARERVEALVEQVKYVFHIALSKQRVQTSKGFLAFLRRAMPVEIAQREVQVHPEEGTQDVATLCAPLHTWQTCCEPAARATSVTHPQTITHAPCSMRERGRRFEDLY